MLAVALIAGFLFIGGGAMIYLSQPQPTSPGTPISGLPSPTRSLDVFVQETPTPIPTPIPTIPPTPTIDPFATPTIDPFATPTPSIEITPTPTSGPVAPDARFSWAQREGTLRIIFTDNSTGTISGWSWDFGDGSSSQEQSPRHVYAAPGQYRVVLTVTGPVGTDQRARDITVAPLPTPTPIPSPTDTLPPSPLTVTINCTQQAVDTWECVATPANKDGSPVTFSWSAEPPEGASFSATTTKRVTITFSSAGAYTIKVIANDGRGVPAEDTEVVTYTTP